MKDYIFEFFTWFYFVKFYNYLLFVRFVFVFLMIETNALRMIRLIQYQIYTSDFGLAGFIRFVNEIILFFISTTLSLLLTLPFVILIPIFLFLPVLPIIQIVLSFI